MVVASIVSLLGRDGGGDRRRRRRRRHRRVRLDGPEGGLCLLLGLCGLAPRFRLLLELPDGGVDEHVEAAERLAVGLGRRRRRRHVAVQLVGAAVDRTRLGESGRERGGLF